MTIAALTVENIKLGLVYTVQADVMLAFYIWMNSRQQQGLVEH